MPLTEGKGNLLELVGHEDLVVNEAKQSFSSTTFSTDTAPILDFIQALSHQDGASKAQTSDPDAAQNESATISLIPYKHKEHKHRLQAFIVKFLKGQSGGTAAIELMHDTVLKKFTINSLSNPMISSASDLKIDMTQAEVDKNIAELIDRGFMEKDEDLQCYEYKASD